MLTKETITNTNQAKRTLLRGVLGIVRPIQEKSSKLCKNPIRPKDELKRWVEAILNHGMRETSRGFIQSHSLTTYCVQTSELPSLTDI